MVSTKSKIEYAPLNLDILLLNNKLDNVRKRSKNANINA